MDRKDWIVLRRGLGVLWLIAAFLQMQPGMFTPAFYGDLSNKVMASVLQTVEESTASWALPFLKFTQNLFIHAPYVVNGIIIVIQLAIGFGLLLPVRRPLMRAAMYGSIVWGLSVWLFGEGLSGLGSLGDMTYYDGFPGSAFVYAFAGWLLLLPAKKWEDDAPFRYSTRSLAGLFWVCVILQLMPINGQWDTGSQLSIFANSGFQTQPGQLAGPVMNFATWVSAHVVAANVMETVFLALAGLAVLFWGRVHRSARIAVYVWLFFSWWFGMDFGYLFSGLSTDLNTAPAIGLILYAMRIPVPRLSQASLPKQASDEPSQQTHRQHEVYQR